MSYAKEAKAYIAHRKNVDKIEKLLAEIGQSENKRLRTAIQDYASGWRYYANLRNGAK